jgi:hypothetical protein
MTTGALIFAFNNAEIDYVTMAAWNASNIQRHLDIPTSLVTDCIDPNLKNVYDKFDRVVVVEKPQAGTRHFEDIGATVDWYNTNRMDAYTLTPYDRTLVVDADFVVANDVLKVSLELDRDFQCFREAYDVTGANDFTSLNIFGEHSFPMWWATVMIFKKSTAAQYIFDSMQMVRDNWQHYRDLYKISRPTYRNDFALSIALGIYSGHTLKVDSIQHQMASVLPQYRLAQMSKDDYRIEYSTSTGTLKYITLRGINFHAMCKRDLGAIVANPL